MSEWWTYTLSDFLPFSPRAYYRLIERHNAAVWPVQLLALGLGVLLLVLLRRPSPLQGRLISLILAALWAWVGWAFHWERYATINWAATYFAWAFAAEAAVLVGAGAVRPGWTYRPSGGPVGTVGVGLLAAAMALYPLLGPALGRGWRQAEVFGIVPDPTVLGTLGLLLLAEGPLRGWALIVPLLWCLVGGATLWALGSAEAWVLGGAAVLSLALRLGARRLARRPKGA